MGKLSSIIAQLDRAETGVALAVSAPVPGSLAQLLGHPRPYKVELVPDVRSPVVRVPDALRLVSVLEDPVAETHAEWLVCVVAKSQRCAFRSLSQRITWSGRAFALTDEGRAWLVRTALSLVDDPAVLGDVCARLAERAR